MFIHLKDTSAVEMPADTYLVFGTVKCRDGSSVSIPNHLLDMRDEQTVRARLLAVFPKIEKFSWIALKKTRDEILELPKWVQKHLTPGTKSIVLTFKEGETVKEKRSHFKVKKGFVHDGRTYKRGMRISLLVNDPRISEYKDSGLLCK